MQAYELAELGALIAVGGSPVLREIERLSESGIQQYWSANRSRFDHWSGVLSEGLRQGESRGRIPIGPWQDISAVMDELFMGGILTRIWTAIACEHDARQGRNHISPIVRRVFADHLALRNQALNLMYKAHEGDWADVSEMNRLRSKAERWADLLLAHVAAECPVDEWALDEPRVKDFAEDLRDQPQSLARCQMWRILQASFTTAFRANSRRSSPNPDSNLHIASAILASFPPDLFDWARLRRSVWMDRMNLTANDAQVMLDELIDLDRPKAHRRGSSAQNWLTIDQT